MTHGLIPRLTLTQTLLLLGHCLYSDSFVFLFCVYHVFRQFCSICELAAVL